MARQIEVSLTFVDQSGRERQTVHRLGRLTIGRDQGNDLTIEDTNLSRTHAVIENVRGCIQVTDCNSRNGTTVNGHPLVGTVQLCDGDIVNLGGGRCDIKIGFPPLPAAPTLPGFSVPMLAGFAVALILAATGVLLAISVWERPAKSAAGENGTHKKDSGTRETGLSTPTPTTTPADHFPLDSSENAKDQVARAVKRVMSKVSNDTAPYISEAGISDVQRRLEGYRGSQNLKEKLRAMKLACPQITTQAQRTNLKPALVMYAALADSEDGDPVTAASTMLPRLLTLRATFGTETANSSLLLIAAYPYPFNPQIGSQARTPHPLASKLMEFGGRRSTVDTSEARSVWFLREKNGITNDAYDLVIRLLAIGIIAQDPSQYGIDVDPLLC